MSEKVAGAVGFEPTNAGSKSRYLTEMRMKKFIEFFGHTYSALAQPGI